MEAKRKEDGETKRWDNILRIGKEERRWEGAGGREEASKKRGRRRAEKRTRE